MLKFNPATGQFEEEQNDIMDATNPAAPVQAIQPESTQPMDPMVRDYLTQKFDLGKYNDEARDKVVADSKLGFGDKAGAALAALGAGFMGRDAAAAGYGALDRASKSKRQSVEDFDTGRKNLIEKFGLDRKATEAGREDLKFGREEDKLKREMDPSSQESKMAQDLAIAMGMNPDQAKGLTAQQFKDFSPVMQKKYEIAERSKDRAEQAALRREMQADRAAARRDALEDRQLRREELNAQRQEKMDIAKEDKIEKDTQKLSDKLGNAQELSNALENVNSKLGFNLDEADVQNGSLKVKGKDVDLPGVSIPGFGRVSAYSGKARELQSAVAKVFNTELKDRSGAAVTTPELERLKTEFGAGKFNTEAEMVQALKDYKRMVGEELRNREAGFRPEVVDRYKGRGGATSERFGNAGSAGKVRVQAPDGSIRLIPKDKLEAAIKAGGKLAE